MKLQINKLVLDTIFCSEFNPLTSNNIIDFTNKSICVLYGPNGTGKTSFTNVMNQVKNSKYEVEFDAKVLTEVNEKIVHVISDQNGRNVIVGSTEDFILGDNIKKEYELKKQLEDKFIILYTSIIDGLKNSFSITTKSSPISQLITNPDLKSYISDLANNKSKGKDIERVAFLKQVSGITIKDIPEHDEIKLKFVINDYAKNSLISLLRNIKLELVKEEKQIRKIDESDTAIKVLEKFHYIDDCIVCDTSIKREILLQSKKDLYQTTINSLSDQTKLIIENIIKKISGDDPFKIQENLQASLINGNANLITQICNEIKTYEEIIDSKLTNLFINTLADSGLISIQSEYEKLLIEKPEFEEEDVLYIETFLNECLDKKITLKRDENNNLKLLLGDQEFLNKGRQDLSLSNGEQNFLSLAFELLKAKKVSQEIIVLDDPISSFDSIYKNKIAYAIIKILNNKKSIVLTHNTDLIKLLEHQHKNCFNLYFINNTSGEENGFIPVNTDEVKILLYLYELLNLLRSGIAAEIVDEKAFVISLVPYMRGYCQITNDIDSKNSLTSIMHGYKTEKVNITDIYNTLFPPGIINNTYEISAQDIIGLDIDNLTILRNDRFPLLNKTLKHSLSYLYLRLLVEKKLVGKYAVNTDKKQLLSDIIIDSFKSGSKDDIQNKVFFLSRKTLLNEFNHFEIDMNIFQPAIDITNSALKKEKSDILLKLNSI
ncbi:AAA family ATPase [Methylotenera sp. L2L1]|uniref:AAA family ATPase n=1 Tax=Methylotenera sp. L2L1 TaxID=1502770 RepID=UPI0005675F6E|nr:AAA family ATPase [Methylotenera sp. L2L1]